ncbi:MAG: SCO family protein [Paracoccaceae bacterium]|nr:SCO family protein [Paracoccaceae bacterium]
MRLASLALGLALLHAPLALAHEGVMHATATEAAAHGPLAQGLALPVNLGGPFALIDQTGHPRTEADPAGHLQLLFFGYANCQQICSVALPQMADIQVGLAARGVALTPVMITVDPLRDTVATIGPALARVSPAIIGLTGDEAALQAAYKAWSVEKTLVFEDPETGPVYAHGSLFYLLDGQGRFLTLIPPILTNERAIDIIAAYAPAG